VSSGPGAPPAAQPAQPPAQPPAAQPQHVAGRPLGWGIVGTGGIARTVAGDLALLPDARIVAVSSRTAERARQFAAGLAVPSGTPSAYDDVADLVADPAVDVVYVATPHGQHHEAALPALLAGKAVLCEKALTVHLADAVALVDAARARHAFLMEAVWMRFSPLVTRLHALVRDGVIGDLRSVHASFGFNPPFDTASRIWDAAAGGGALLDLGVYTVSFAQFLLGDPESVAVHGSLAPNGVDADATLLLRYPDGVTAVAESTLRGPVGSRATVLGTTGRVDLAESFLDPRSIVLRRDGHEPEELTAPVEGAGYLPQLREVTARVRAGDVESAVMPHADSLSVLGILTDALAELGVSHP